MEFRPIPWFEAYEISREGLVRRRLSSAQWVAGRVVPVRCGSVTLVANGTKQRLRISHLIARTFQGSYAEIVRACDLPGEMWASIDGYDAYEVSNMGRVRAIAPRYGSPGRTLKPIWRRGYAHVCLFRPGHRRQWRIQRLVCTAFHGPPPSPDHHANHINGDKSNNRADNLEWNSAAQNIQHSWRTGLHKNTRRGSGTATSILTESKVRQIKLLLGTVSYTGIADRFGVSMSCIARIAQGKSWKHVV